MTSTQKKTPLNEWSASQLLAIAENEPERLFTGEKAALKDEFRALSKMWHPDINRSPLAKDVFAHINKLHGEAIRKIEAGSWSVLGSLLLRDTEGKAYRVKYLKKHDFELGQFYISKTVVTYVIDKSLAGDLAENGLRRIKSLTYADAKLRAEFENRMPALIKSFTTAESVVCVFKKDPGMVLLSDLRDYILEHDKKRLDPKHVAWVMSRLHSITCFLAVNELTHNGITADTVFVSPEMHTAAILGGWWYAALEGTDLKGLPGAALSSVPHGVLTSGKATKRVDLEMIRAVGRDLLGDTTGTLLLRDPDVKPAMRQWLTDASSGDAFKDFRIWSEEVLKNSFGARRFTVLPVSFSDVYPNI